MRTSPIPSNHSGGASSSAASELTLRLFGPLGIDHQPSGGRVEQCGPIEHRGVDIANADQHRHGLGAGEQGDVAPAAAGLRGEAARLLPVDFQKLARRHVVDQQDRPFVPVRVLPGVAAEAGDQPIAQVDEVGGTCREGLALRLREILDVLAEDLFDRAPRITQLGSSRQQFGHEHIVFEQLDLEFEDFAA